MVEPPYTDPPDERFAKVRELLRVITAGLGVVAIAVGLYLAITLFVTIKSGLTSPDTVEPLVRQWAEVLAPEGQTIELAGGAYPAGTLLAVTVIGGGSFLLMWIAVGLLGAGARVVSWVVSDVEAVKRLAAQILRSSPARRPGGSESSSGDTWSPSAE